MKAAKPEIELNSWIPYGHHLEVGYVPDRKWNRLNKLFIAVAREAPGMPTVFDLLSELSGPALKVWAELMRHVDSREMIVYLPVKQTNHLPLREMEKCGMLKRLKRQEHPRKVGFTTVLISPYYIATSNESIVTLWNTIHER